jgi:lysophospholipase L1-like esterase
MEVAHMTSNSVTVYLAGGSSAQSFTPDRSPLAGWGQMLQPFFQSNVAIANHSNSGKSTKSFIEENRLEPISQAIGKGDYFLIHFGHNDAIDGPRHTDPFTTFQTYLSKYAETARSREATPIFVTPVSKRRFSEAGTFIPTLPEYTEAVHELAGRLQVDVIDLNRSSAELYEQWGGEWTQRLFLWLTPGEHPHFPNGMKDNDHFNEYGALRIARLVVEEIKSKQLSLANLLL